MLCLHAIPGMGDSVGQGSSSAARGRSHHSKLWMVIERHGHCRKAFSDLKSHILIGLAEAKEVFDSLSSPLMKLVGIKNGEMAEERRSTSILIDRDPQPFSRVRGIGSGGSKMTGEHFHRSNEGKKPQYNYSTHAKNELLKLQATQQQDIQHLILLLRVIEHTVNNHQETIFQALDSHRNSLYTIFKQSAAALSELPRSTRHQGTTNATAYIILRALKVALDRVDSALDQVGDEVERLLKNLAAVMCAPMASHVKGLQEQATKGFPIQLVSMVEELEMALKEQLEVESKLDRALQMRGNAVMELERALGSAMVEMEVARKKARIEEEEKLESTQLYLEYQEKFRRLKQFILKGELSKRSQQQAMAGEQLPLLPPTNNDQRGLITSLRSPTGDCVKQKTPDLAVHRDASHTSVFRRPITRSITNGSQGQLTPASTTPPCPRSAPPPLVHRRSSRR